MVGDKLIYDAPTAHGGSGGPVFDSQGEVIGVNAAYIDGFPGVSLGFSVRALKPLIDHARATQESKPQRINAPIPAAPTAGLSAVGTTTTASNQLPKTE